MKTIQDIHAKLTAKEFEMLEAIVDSYSIQDNICFDDEVTPSQKGLITQLKAKNLIYDSFEDMHDDLGYERSNWFPADEVLYVYGLEHC